MIPEQGEVWNMNSASHQKQVVDWEPQNEYEALTVAERSCQYAPRAGQERVTRRSED